MTVKANGDVDIIDRVIMKYLNNFHNLSSVERAKSVYNFDKVVRQSIDTETFNKMFNESCTNYIDALYHLAYYNNSQQKRYLTNLLRYKGLGQFQLWLEAFDQVRCNITEIQSVYDLCVENYYVEQQDFFTLTGCVLSDEFYINLGYFKGMMVANYETVNVLCYMMDEYISTHVSDSIMEKLDEISFFNRELKLQKRKEMTKQLSQLRYENAIDHFDDSQLQTAIIKNKNEYIVLFRNAETLKNISLDNFLNDCQYYNTVNNIETYISENIDYYENVMKDVVQNRY